MKRAVVVLAAVMVVLGQIGCTQQAADAGKIVDTIEGHIEVASEQEGVASATSVASVTNEAEEAATTDGSGVATVADYMKGAKIETEYGDTEYTMVVTYPAIGYTERITMGLDVQGKVVYVAGQQEFSDEAHAKAQYEVMAQEKGIYGEHVQLNGVMLTYELPDGGAYAGLSKEDVKEVFEQNRAIIEDNN